MVRTWDCLGTLYCQTGDKFTNIIAQLQAYLNSIGVEKIAVPHTTRAWVARRVDQGDAGGIAQETGRKIFLAM